MLPRERPIVLQYTMRGLGPTRAVCFLTRERPERETKGREGRGATTEAEGAHLLLLLYPVYKLSDVVPRRNNKTIIPPVNLVPGTRLLITHTASMINCYSCCTAAVMSCRRRF